FLEYADAESSTKARAGLRGRKFNGNQVVVSFYPENKFKHGFGSMETSPESSVSFEKTEDTSPLSPPCISAELLMPESMGLKLKLIKTRASRGGDGAWPFFKILLLEDNDEDLQEFDVAMFTGNIHHTCHHFSSLNATSN
ncbi:splicing factor U2af large subunit A-like protein isoform X5, partial [Tanacetum coccineum]